MVPRIPKRPKHLDAEASKDVTEDVTNKNSKRADLLDGSCFNCHFFYGMTGLISEVRKGVNEDFKPQKPRAEVQKQEPFPKEQSIRVFCDNKVAFLLYDTPVIKDLSPVFRSCAHRN